jgi:multiple sugar transport system permease protein
MMFGRAQKRRSGIGTGGVRSGVSYGNMAVLAVALLYFLFPVYWLIISATKAYTQLFSTNGFLPGSKFSVFTNLQALFTFQHSVYLYWFGNTLLYAVVGGGIATVIAAVAGYAFGKYDFRGKGLAFGVILGGVLVPGTALVLPLYLLFDKLSLLNSYWSIIIPSTISPFGMYLARIYASRGIPDEILEAARVDGAREATVFRKIGFPMMKPALVTIFLFQFVATFNDYFLPLVMLNNTHLYPMALGLNSWSALTTLAGTPPDIYTVILMGALVSVLPLVVAVVLLQRYWSGGLGVGAVKG